MTGSQTWPVFRSCPQSVNRIHDTAWQAQIHYVPECLYKVSWVFIWGQAYTQIPILLTPCTNGYKWPRESASLHSNSDQYERRHKEGTISVQKRLYMPWNKGKSMSTEDSSEDSNDSPSLPEPSRMKEKEYYLVTNTSRDGTSRTMPDCEGASGSTRLLRPAKASSSDSRKWHGNSDASVHL